MRTAAAVMLAIVLSAPAEEKESPMPANPLAVESLSQFVLYPKDIEVSKAFYMEKLGFSLAYPFGGGPVKGYQLQAGGLGLTLLSIEGGPKTKVENLMLHVRVPDVESCHKALEALQVPITRKLSDTDWGTRWFQVQDPDGVTLAFEQPRPSPANAAFRKLGQARLEAFRSKETEKKPQPGFPITFGACWKQCSQYAVDDFAAETGFWMDGLGLPVNAFGPDYAMFTSPGRDFFFSIVPASKANPATPKEAVRLEFMVEDLPALAAELERRGIRFEKPPAPESPGSPMWKGSFRTPHGIAVNLWSLREPKP